MIPSSYSKSTSKALRVSSMPVSRQIKEPSEKQSVPGYMCIKLAVMQKVPRTPWYCNLRGIAQVMEHSFMLMQTSTQSQLCLLAETGSSIASKYIPALLLSQNLFPLFDAPMHTKGTCNCSPTGAGYLPHSVF